MNEHAQKRQEVLAALYRAREAKPHNGWLSEFDLKNACGDIAFAVSVLEEVGHLRRDGNRYRITGHGVIAHEAAL